MTEVLLVDIILLTLVTVVGVAIIRVRSLFAATMLSGLYSLIMAMAWSNMHALDVGFTEAAVGAGASTVLLLGCIAATGRISKDDSKVSLPALAIVLVTGGLLLYGTLDMPAFGDPEAPIHNLRVPRLLGQDVGKHPDRALHVSPKAHADDHADTHADGAHGDDHADGHAHPEDDFDGHVPNTVTSLLAAYRGYDTMFETAVIFTAGISLVLLLRRRDDEIAEQWHERAADTAVATGEGPQPADTHRDSRALISTEPPEANS